jgi:hypothetical protein
VYVIAYTPVKPALGADTGLGLDCLHWTFGKLLFSPLPMGWHYEMKVRALARLRVRREQPEQRFLNSEKALHVIGHPVVPFSRPKLVEFIANKFS